MNEYNHHRIIERFAANEKSLTYHDVQVLKDASNFTDDFGGFSNKDESIGKQKEFFFYHFYYDINCQNNTIMLSRNSQKDYNMDKSMDNCENNKELHEDRSKAGYRKWFFSAINDREDFVKYSIKNRALLKEGMGVMETQSDSSNQSECVAFLHAMGAIGPSSVFSETEERTKTVFIEHQKKCFAEFLFIEDRDMALFILGIALHGIMDSFTPSHTAFQKYASQNMALHAQGDVVPIKGIFDDVVPIKGVIDNGIRFNVGTEKIEEEIDFIPAQYNKDPAILGRIKGFNDNNHINDTEFEMLKIFFLIGDITDKNTGRNYTEDWSTFVRFWKTFKGSSLDEIRRALNKGYKYGDTAYIYSETAIKVLGLVYSFLEKERQNCLGNYEYYKTNKESIIENAILLWKNQYDEFQNHYKKRIELLVSLFQKKSFDKIGLSESVIDIRENKLEQMNNIIKKRILNI